MSYLQYILFVYRDDIVSVVADVCLPGFQAPVNYVALTLNSTSSTDWDDVAMTTVVNGTRVTGIHNRYRVTEHSALSVVCVVGGSGAMPDLRVTYGRHQARADVTGRFERTERVTTLGPGGLNVDAFEVTLRDDGLKVMADDDGKHIKCSARVHGYPQLTRHVSASLDVRCT